jgi:hypothetical protein
MHFTLCLHSIGCGSRDTARCAFNRDAMRQYWHAAKTFAAIPIYITQILMPASWTKPVAWCAIAATI